MSFISSTIGGEGGNEGGAGLNYNAAGVPLLTTVTQEQVNNANSTANNGLAQQQAFINALAAQNGIQNQSNVFNQQQALANQFQGVANGTGPNPAAAALAQATGANVANQAALMAGQRGAGANAGLIARQAAQQGGALQQQAAGQGATMQAQQQLNAMQALQGQQANMSNLASTQVGQQAGAQQAYNQNALANQANLLNAGTGLNNSSVNMQSNRNSANAGISQVAAGQQGQLLGGAIKGASMAFASGGEVPAMPQQSYQTGYQAAAPSSGVGRFLSGVSDTMSAPTDANSQTNGSAAMNSAGQAAGGDLVKGIKSLFSSAGGGDAAAGGGAEMASGAPMEMAMAKGGKVPAMVSPGEIYLRPGQVKEVADGKDAKKVGEKIPGKASVKGNSLKNDTVPKALDVGGVVIPRSVMNSKDPAANAAKFVQALMAKQGLKK